MVNGIILFDFNRGSTTENWNVINDVVMGGRSEADFSLNSEGYGVFRDKFPWKIMAVFLLYVIGLKVLM